MSLPAGPDLPPWRQAQVWIERPVEFWRECACAFGDTFTVQLGSIGPTVLFSRPEDVRQIFRLPPDTFECRQFNEHYAHVMGEESLLVSDGASHRRRRRLFTPALHRQVGRYAPLVRRVTKEVVSQWPAGESFPVRASLHALSLQIVLQIVFGPPEREFSRELIELFTGQILHELGTWSPWARFRHLHPHLRQRIAAAVSQRRQREVEGDGSTLFDELVLARDVDGQPLSDAEIQDQIFTMLIAGVDPTALALAWALYWIHDNPAVRLKVLEELAALGPDADPSQAAELPYLTAACQESLRMYPVVATPSGRKLSAATAVADRSYPAGVTLLPCTYLVHRREDLFPDPDQFRPERFLERRYAAHEYFPFGGGNRLCIGATLAMLELKVALATILAEWDLGCAHRGPVTPVRHGTLLAPSPNLALVVKGPARLAAGRAACGGTEVGSPK